MPLTILFSKNISIYAIFNDQSFNDMLNNNIISFEQLGPGYPSYLQLFADAVLMILKILPPKNENFNTKNSDIFHVSAQTIDCGYSLELPQRGGSNEYPQSMFLSRNKKNNVYPCKP